MRRLQDAPPPLAHACLGVRRFMRETLRMPEPWPLCVAAVSGGADSTALLLCLRLLGVPLIVVHLDHALRRESADEARHVAELAASFGLECVARREDVAAVARERGVGLEDAGRQCRYALLENVRRERGAEWIVTGHHLDDLSEDVLLRLIRGGGWPALAGMSARDDVRRVLRPLLHTPRAELEAWLRMAGLSWCEDASNHGREARRNRIRHDILPLIRAENPAFGQAVRRLWQQARQDEDYWRGMIEPEMPAAGPADGILLARERLDKLHPAARLRLYLACVRRLRDTRGAGQGVQARADALLRLDALWRARRTGAVLLLPGVSVRVLRNGLRFSGNGNPVLGR